MFSKFECTCRWSTLEFHKNQIAVNSKNKAVQMVNPYCDVSKPASFHKHRCCPTSSKTIVKSCLYTNFDNGLLRLPDSDYGITVDVAYNVNKLDLW